MKCESCGEITGKLARVMTFRTKDPVSKLVGEVPVQICYGDFDTKRYLCFDCAGFEQRENVDFIPIKPKKGEVEVLREPDRKTKELGKRKCQVVLEMLKWK